MLTIVLCWVGIGLAALALGYVHYLAGLLAYTAAGQFPDLSKRPLALYSGEVSLLLWTPINQTSVFSPERMMVGGGLIGCIVAIWLGSARQREVAFGVAFAEAGVSNHWLDYWFGPAIWYYESYFALLISFLLLVPRLAARRAGSLGHAPAAAGDVCQCRRRARAPAGNRPLCPCGRPGGCGGKPGESDLLYRIAVAAV
jgi:hypothetical protein